MRRRKRKKRKNILVTITWAVVHFGRLWVGLLPCQIHSWPVIVIWAVWQWDEDWHLQLVLELFSMVLVVVEGSVNISGWRSRSHFMLSLGL